MQHSDVRQAKRVLTYQTILGMVAVAFALPFGASVVLSVVIGAGACILANALFATLVFRGYRAQEPGRLVMRIYGAELAKLGLILGAFTIAFMTLDDLSLPALLGAYLAIQVIPPLIAAQLPERTTK
ncbi:F0F1 ATP synthase assembly protein I [Thiocapsa imhoffii]|uniref:F0F1 ATP synthase assembly protein I n=1 Tax=Thiocapsa imhoffii TaxID=382777 RepID=A0A9X1B6T5_9GAMM|nr:ATP synthase subunit I [Thiocapsa imhoffii]MBK1643084.1 F0F1 ATP synthase assembly protein I [Thiocapsa imhoffii]